MYKEALQSIEGIGIFPVLALIMFLAAFVGIVVWVWRIDREVISSWSNIPLDITPQSVHEEENRG